MSVASKASARSGEAPLAAPKPSSSSEAEEATRKRWALQRALLAIAGQSVLQHLIVIQSEVSLFTDACGGDISRTARNLVNTASVTGLAGLLANQVGGKLSDAIGRKPFFAVGPIVNIVVGLLVFSMPKSLRVLFITRIFKLIATTFSGTVMCQAAAADSFVDEEQDAFNAKMPVVIGAAVVSGPFIESLVTKLARGRHRFVYLALALVSSLQLLTSSFVPETLAPSKRISMEEFSKSLSSINPLSFLKIYTGEHGLLKRLVTVTTLQNFLEGRSTSDVFQMWARNNLKWPAETTRNYVSAYGAMNILSGGLQMMCAQRMSVRAYTLFTSLAVGLGTSLEGLAPRGICMWLSLPVVMPGINGGHTLKLKRVQTDVAAECGIGQGEFSAWVNNARAVCSSLAPWMYGQWYAWCEKQGFYGGTVWPLAGFMGSFLPLALFLQLPRDALENGGVAGTGA